MRTYFQKVTLLYRAPEATLLFPEPGLGIPAICILSILDHTTSGHLLVYYLG